MQVFRNGWFLFICTTLLVAANVGLYRAIFAPRALEVSVLDVGEKGSAALVHTPSDMTVLVDTGPDAGVLRALGGALPLWQRRIDAVILTGTKASSVGGLPDVERRYRVGAIVRIGDERIPYGASLVFGDARLLIISPDVFAISYGTTVLTISSTTPAGVYILDGVGMTRTK